MATIYENMSEYNESLQGEFKSATGTTNNGIGMDCTITFKLNASFNLDFLSLPNSPSPLNFKLFNKMEDAAEIISDINKIFIKQIENLECCGLSKKYNDNILPLFMFIVGDAGTEGDENYGAWRKDDGVFPIIIKTARELLKSYKIIKNLNCIFRPVPGNPWIKTAGIDWMKPIYGPLGTIDFISKAILDGDYLDILLNPAKAFRDGLFQCSGKKINHVFQDTANTSMDPAGFELALSVFQKEYSSKTMTIPLKTEEQYKLEDELIINTKELINKQTLLKNHTMELEKLNSIYASLESIISEYTLLINNNKESLLDQEFTLAEYIILPQTPAVENQINISTLKIAELTKLIETHTAILNKAKSDLQTTFMERDDLLNNIIANLNKEIEDYNKEFITDIAKKLNSLDIEYKKKMEVYNKVQVAREKRYASFGLDCPAMAKIKAAEVTKMSGSCSCLMDLLEIFVPVPEIVLVKNRTELEQVYGRIPYTIEDIKNFKKKDYKVISESNINDRFDPKPLLMYQERLIVKENSYFKKYDVGNIIDDYTKPVKKYYDAMDEIEGIKNIMDISGNILKERNVYLKEKLQIDKEIKEYSIWMKETLIKRKIDNNKQLSSLKKQYNSNILDFVLPTINSLLEENRIIDNVISFSDDLYTLNEFVNNPGTYPNESKLLNNLKLTEQVYSNSMITDYAPTMPSKYILKILDCCNENIKICDELIRANTRILVILSKENIPCDCSIICKLLQYFVDMIMKAVNNLINAIIAQLVAGLMTKEMAYIIKFIKAKMQCYLDLVAIPDNLDKIKAKADSTIEGFQNSIIKMNEPTYCNELKKPTELVLSPKNEKEIKDAIIDFNFSNSDAGEQVLDKVGNTVNKTELTVFNYPNTSGYLDNIATNKLNNNYLVINDVTPGKQYQFRNIPTLEFNCEDPMMNPTFDIFIDEVPEIWSLYLSFKLNEPKLESLENLEVITQKPKDEQNIIKYITDTLEITEDKIPTNLQPVIDIEGMIAKAKALIEANNYEKMADECTPEELEAADAATACSFIGLELVKIELIPLNEYSEIKGTFNINPFNVDINILESNITNVKMNIPIKVTVKKIFAEKLAYVTDESEPEITSVILLLDAYNLGSDTIGKDYNKVSTYDPNVLFGRYPIEEIGFKNTVTGEYHLENYPAPVSVLTEEIILKFCEKALIEKKKFDINQFKPTPEEIAKQKEKLENQILEQKCINNTSNGLTQDVNNALNNTNEIINNKLIPELEDLLTKVEGSIELSNEYDKTPETIPEINKIITDQVTTLIGIPIIELNGDKKIAAQILKVNIGTTEIPNYKYRVNISNFNFLSNFLSVGSLLKSDTFEMDINPEETYFLSIVFDGSTYKFSLINEIKQKETLTKLNTEVLFPSRFGRMSDISLKDQTFCGTLLDLGVTNTIIDPELFYKFSLLNFKPKTPLFIDFESRVNEKFYSTSDFGVAGFEQEQMNDTVKKYIEDNYLNYNPLTEIPYYLYNKYITVHGIKNNMEIYTNDFKTVSQNNYFTNFFCKESIKNQSFTISFWVKKLPYLELENEYRINKEREVLISDTKYFNNIFYNSHEKEIVFEFTKMDHTYKTHFEFRENEWMNFIVRFDHITNSLQLLYATEHENSLHIITIPLIKKLDFNLISMLSEFDFITKEFRNFFLCQFGNLIIDNKYLNNEKLNDFFVDQKICFKGC